MKKKIFMLLLCISMFSGCSRAYESDYMSKYSNELKSSLGNYQYSEKNKINNKSCVDGSFCTNVSYYEWNIKYTDSSGNVRSFKIRNDTGFNIQINEEGFNVLDDQLEVLSRNYLKNNEIEHIFVNYVGATATRDHYPSKLLKPATINFTNFTKENNDIRIEIYLMGEEYNQSGMYEFIKKLIDKSSKPIDVIVVAKGNYENDSEILGSNKYKNIICYNKNKPINCD
jgi:hypothetical protein